MLKKKRVAIITNNIHCERHYQYFSTLEKYFKINGWEVAEDLTADKIIICGCGFHDAMYEKVLRVLKEIREKSYLEKNIIIMACLTKTHEKGLRSHFKGHILEFHSEEQLDQLIQAGVPFKKVPPVNVYRIPKKCGTRQKKNDYFHIKISQGCLRECTFCVINKAKGPLKSVPFREIETQLRKARETGYKKILLMGEDTFDEIIEEAPHTSGYGMAKTRILEKDQKEFDFL
jgi:tRNA A37 methylthiotransferase MiaB